MHVLLLVVQQQQAKQAEATCTTACPVTHQHRVIHACASAGCFAIDSACWPTGALLVGTCRWLSNNGLRQLPEEIGEVPALESL